MLSVTCGKNPAHYCAEAIFLRCWRGHKHVSIFNKRSIDIDCMKHFIIDRPPAFEFPIGHYAWRNIATSFFRNGEVHVFAILFDQENLEHHRINLKKETVACCLSLHCNRNTYNA